MSININLSINFISSEITIKLAPVVGHVLHRQLDGLRGGVNAGNADLCVDGCVGIAAVQLGRVAVAGGAVVGLGRRQKRQHGQEDQKLQEIRIQGGLVVWQWVGLT